MPIRTVEEAELFIAKIILAYKNDYVTVLKNCKKSKGWNSQNNKEYGTNRYSSFTHHNPNAFTDYSLWDLLNN